MDSFWIEIGRAFALMLVIEGLLPFASPRRWRGMLSTISNSGDQAVRTVGLASMVLGLIILYLL